MHNERFRMLATVEALEAREAISRSDTPRITAMRYLPGWRLRVLYLYKNIDVAEIMGTFAAFGWTYAMAVPEDFIKHLPTYALLLTEGSATFWALCWLGLALMKLLALVTGNLYIRRVAYGLGAVAWSANAGIMYLDGRHWTILVTWSLAFFIGAVWHYVDTKLELDARNEERDATLSAAIAEAISTDGGTKG